MFKQRKMTKQREHRHFLILKSYGSTAMASIAFLICWISAPYLQAQLPPQADIGELQKQLETLQNQIASFQNQKQSGQSVQQDSRVRSVGSQRIKRVQPLDEDPMQIRLYDLSDLFVVSPSYPAQRPHEFGPHAMFDAGKMAFTGGIGQGGGGFGGGGQGGSGFGGGGMGGGGVFRVGPVKAWKQPQPPVAKKPAPRQEAGSLAMRSAQVSMDQLVTTIQNTVEPEMWDSDQGDASVQFLGNTLLITATESMHSQITNLLNLFREHWGRRRTVSVQTFWIRAGAGDTADLLDAKASEIGAGVVDADKWNKYLADARTEKRFAYSATLTGHNNQTLHALSGEQKQLVVGATPYLKTDAAMWFEDPEDVSPFGEDSDDDEDMDYFNRTRKIVGFHPVRQSFQNGAVIQLTPLATRGGNFVILDLHAKFNELSKPAEGAEQPSAFVVDDKEKSEVKLDHVDFVTCRLNTTLRCPTEEVVLAGSMTFDPNSDEEHPNIYVFVKTFVHTITEDKSDWTPDNRKADEAEGVTDGKEHSGKPKEEKEIEGKEENENGEKADDKN